MNKKITAIFLIIILLASVMISSSAADMNETETDTASSPVTGYCGVSRKIKAVSYRGEYGDKFAENSLQAIRHARKDGADAVYVNIKFTQDGVAVLCADDNLTRVTDCEIDTPVSEMTFEEIGAYSTKAGTGGKNAKTTPYHIYSLAEVMDSVDNSVPLMLDFEWEHFDDVYEVVRSCRCLPTAIFICRCKPAEYKTKISSLEKKPNTVLFRKTNVVFNAIATVKAAESIENGSAWLATSNTYGVNWKHSVMKHFVSSHAVVCTAEPGLSGKRYDTESYWDDLVSRGYNVIISSDIKKLAEYCKESFDAADELARYVEKVTENGNDYSSFRSYEAIDYVKAYNDALSDSESALSRACGKREANECLYRLKTAINDIETNYTAIENGVAGKTVNAARITVALIAVACVLAAEFYCYKKRKK